MIINNVRIGDRFTKNKHICEVVDFHIITSWLTNEIVNYVCIAKGENNKFEVPFSFVVRNRI